MIEQFLESYVKKITNIPEKIHIKKHEVQDGVCCLDIFVSTEDMGKVIGKDGRMISALKTFVSGCKAKDGITYKITVHPNEN